MKASWDLKDAISAVRRREAKLEASECLSAVILQVERQESEKKIREEFEKRLVKERISFDNQK